MQVFQEIRSYEDNFSIWHAKYENMVFFNHWHNEIELIYAKKGTSKIIINNTLYTLRAGDLLICGSKNMHSCTFETPSNCLEFILFKAEAFLPEDSILDKCLYLSAQELDSKKLSDQAEQLFSLVSTELANRNPCYQAIVSSTITTFWYMIKRHFPEPFADSGFKKTEFNKIENAISYMKGHYTEQITLEDVSKIANFSPSYFSQIFHRITGISFVKFLQIIRINAAIPQLYENKKRILDISLDNGFSNVRSFNRIFKSWTGMTPQEFSKLPKEKVFFIPLPHSGLGTPLFVQNQSSVVSSLGNTNTE